MSAGFIEMFLLINMMKDFICVKDINHLMQSIT